MVFTRIISGAPRLVGGGSSSAAAAASDLSLFTSARLASGQRAPTVVLDLDETILYR
jgi:hypothetical protein